MRIRERRATLKPGVEKGADKGGKIANEIKRWRDGRDAISVVWPFTGAE